MLVYRNMVEKKKRTHGKLANFNIVDTGGFFLLGGAQTQGRHEAAEEIQGAKNYAGAEERVSTTTKRIGELVAELNPVLVEPAACDDGVAIEMGNVVTVGC